MKMKRFSNLTLVELMTSPSRHDDAYRGEEVEEKIAVDPFGPGRVQVGLIPKVDPRSHLRVMRERRG